MDTFREQGGLVQDAAAWRKLRAELRKAYAVWQETLTPLWQQALIDGQPAQDDPFLVLLNVEEVSTFRGNWRAMQTLPAAREAINKLLMALQIQE